MCEKYIAEILIRIKAEGFSDQISIQSKQKENIKDYEELKFIFMDILFSDNKEFNNLDLFVEDIKKIQS